MTVRIIEGDCLERMPQLDAASVDAVVTDPPYGLTQNKKGGSGVASVDLSSPYGRTRITVGEGPGGFMGMGWDRGVPGVEYWQEALRVLKPGGHLLAFGGTRTHHRLMVAIEDAGFEIRDCLMWLYGSGFPKSKNLGNGWGTALKPAWEPIVLARKPLIGTVAANVQVHGTGALNIDCCRIAAQGRPLIESSSEPSLNAFGNGLNGSRHAGSTDEGRWPANVLLDEDAAALLDLQSGVSRSTGGQASLGAFRNGDVYGKGRDERERRDPGFGDTGGASRFFYTAKASRAERNRGLGGMAARRVDPVNHTDERVWDIPGSHAKPRANHHPTVKPLDLMQWLCRLVTPPGGTILDPFAGSGSTLIAADREGFNAIGIELDPGYAEIARRRVYGDAPLFAGVA